MFCNNCGSTIPDNVKFCPKCGFNFNKPDSSQKPNGRQKNKNRNILIICIVVAVVLCVVFLLYSQGAFDNSAKTPNAGTVNNDRIVADKKIDEDKDEPKDEVDHSEAYAAYLDILHQKNLDIDTYDRNEYTFDWKVAFLDVDGMSHPLMVIEALDDGEYYADYDDYYFSNNLRVYSYNDGLTLEVDKHVWHSAKATGDCSVFTTKDGGLYYVHWDGNEGGCHLAIERYSIDSTGLTEEDTWKIDAYVLPFYDDYSSPGTTIIDLEHWREIEHWYEHVGENNGSSYLEATDYSKNGKLISQKEFFDDIDKILAQIDTMSIKKLPEILIRPADGDLEKTFSLKSYKSNAMSYDDAIEMLGGEVEYQVDNPMTTTTGGNTNPIFPYISASSTRASMGNNSYGPEKARDDDWATAWCEGQSGNGVGAWIELRADTAQTVSGIRILNGYCKSEKTYYDNNTVREVCIETDEGSAYWPLDNSPNSFQNFNFTTPIKTKSIRITIELVNEQGDGKDTLISEFAAF